MKVNFVDTKLSNDGDGCDGRSDGDKVAVPPAMLLCCSIKYKARTAQRARASATSTTAWRRRRRCDGRSYGDKVAVSPAILL